jgi:hypothetical protein
MELCFCSAQAVYVVEVCEGLELFFCQSCKDQVSAGLPIRREVGTPCPESDPS